MILSVKEIVSEYEEKDDGKEEEEEKINETDTSLHINPKTLIKRYNFVLLISTNFGSLRFSSSYNARIRFAYMYVYVRYQTRSVATFLQ